MSSRTGQAETEAIYEEAIEETNGEATGILAAAPEKTTALRHQAKTHLEYEDHDTY